MKKLIKAASLLLALVLLASLSGAAFASTAYTAVNGPASVPMTKYLTVDADANIPAATFTFTVSAYEGSDYVAGPNPELVKVNGTAASGTVSFTANETATTASADDTNVPVAAGKKYATKPITLDFSAVSFNEPGFYAYKLTETAPSTPFSGDEKAERTIVIYVEDIEGALVVNSTVNIFADDAKNPNYVNTFSSAPLEFSKTVTGNQGSKDKFFKFTVSLTNLGAGTVVNVDGSNLTAEPAKTPSTTYEAADMKDANSVTTLTAGDDGSVTQDFYLSNGESVTITGLPVGSHYEITEAAEGYTQSVVGDASGDIVANGAVVAFTNNRESTVPTGVLLTIAPFAALMLIGAVGAVVVLKKKAGKA